MVRRLAVNNYVKLSLAIILVFMLSAFVHSHSTAVATNNVTILTVNEQNFKKEVLDSPLPVVVDFYADWCIPCQGWAVKLEKLANDPKFKGKIRFVRINKDLSQSLAAAHQIGLIPHSLAINKGQVVDHLIGNHPENVLEDFCTRLLQAK